MEKPCLRCGKIIEKVKPSHMNKIFYCSRHCMAESYKIRLKGVENPNWKGGISRIDGECKYCFIPINKANYMKGAGSYCSLLCKNRYFAVGKKMKCLENGYKHDMRKPPKVYAPKHKCEDCGSRVGRAYIKICKACQHQRRRSMYVKVVCKKCGLEKSFPPCKSHRVYCSHKCMNNDRVGEKNQNYKGGITPENKRIRGSQEYKDWRKAVFERDNYTCVHCGQVGWTLHADHIKPFAYFPELRLEISNGRTLCEACHKKTDTWARRYTKKIGDELSQAQIERLADLKKCGGISLIATQDKQTREFILKEFQND